MAAAYRSLGFDATVTPDSNDETLDLGGLYSGGEECLPHKITLGDFVRVCRSPGFDPAKACLLYTSPSPRDRTRSRMPSSA